MGPLTLFDKSFLQTVNLDEAVWFDHFLSPIICPLFFVETLAGLSKTKNLGKFATPEDLVSNLALKTPVFSGIPCAHHLGMCISNLLGQNSPKSGQVPLAGGRPIRNANGKPGVVFKPSAEAESFSRWQQGQFHEIERDHAREWREMLANLNLSEIAFGMRSMGINPQNCKTIQEAFNIANQLVSIRYQPEQQLDLLFRFVKIPQHLWEKIVERWAEAEFPPLREHASYAAHVLKVELFFHIALAAKLISSDRPSHRVDMAYLYYLPFCNAFVSGDKLHRLCAPIFLTQQQDFIWAPDLKDDLKKINEKYSKLPEKEREQGLLKLAPLPPDDVSGLISALWKKHGYFPNVKEKVSLTAEAEQKLVSFVNSMSNAPTDQSLENINSEELDSVSIERFVPPHRGNFWVIPKEIADKELKVAEQKEIVPQEVDLRQRRSRYDKLWPAWIITIGDWY